MPTPTPPPSPPQSQPNRVVVACVTAVGLVIALNLAFFILSMSYFDSHKELVDGALIASYTPAKAMSVRIAFAVCSLVVVGAGAVAWLHPRVTGHLLVALFGASYLISLVRGLFGNAPGVLLVVWLVAGGVMLLLAWPSYQRRSRASWSVLVAMCGTLALCELFGAPRIAHALDISLWLSMVAPGLKLVAMLALIMSRSDYSEGELTAA
jgi:hypothetical protein